MYTAQVRMLNKFKPITTDSIYSVHAWDNSEKADDEFLYSRKLKPVHCYESSHESQSFFFKPGSVTVPNLEEALLLLCLIYT